MIYVVGIGPGDKAMRTAQATQAIASADILVGYKLYIDLVREEFPDKPTCENGMLGEVDRCRAAVEFSRSGKTVAMLCSGDASVYGMASLVLELADAGDAVEIIPGVTAALSASAVLGAPLGGDLVILSLSDRLTPWETIERRLRAAGMGDFPMAIYNPVSKKRADHLARAVDLLLMYKSPDTLCGFVRNIGREAQEHKILTLRELRDAQVDMFTTVIIGCEGTICKNNRLITPRGYRK